MSDLAVCITRCGHATAELRTERVGYVVSSMTRSCQFLLDWLRKSWTSVFTEDLAERGVAVDVHGGTFVPSSVRALARCEAELAGSGGEQVTCAQRVLVVTEVAATALLDVRGRAAPEVGATRASIRRRARCRCHRSG